MEDSRKTNKNINIDSVLFFPRLINTNCQSVVASLPKSVVYIEIIDWIASLPNRNYK